MNEALRAEIRRRVGIVVALAAYDDDNSDAHKSLELELRFGELDARGAFVAGLPAGLWYALFQYMYRSPSTRTRSEFSMMERDEQLADVRVLHTRTHCGCVRQRKSPLAPKITVPLFDDARGMTSSAMVRVATSRETRLTGDACAGVPLISIPQCIFRRRERRSIYLIDSATGMRSCWRFDFTRINDNQAYELELELNVRQVFRQLPDAEVSVRSDAVVRQLDSLLVCLSQSLVEANRVYQQHQSQMAAQRAAEVERLRPRAT